LGISLSLGIGSLISGNVNEAEALIGSCLDSARQQGYRGIQANAARQLAVLRAKTGAETPLIQSLFDEAIAVAGQIEARPSAALAMLSHAEFLASKGSDASARSLAFAADQEFSRMGMQSFIARARRILG
jgi:hypothetical protein